MIDWGAWDVALAVAVGDTVCLIGGYLMGRSTGVLDQYQADRAALEAVRAAAREARRGSEACGPSPRAVAELIPLDTRLVGPAIKERAQ